MVICNVLVLEDPSSKCCVVFCFKVHSRRSSGVTVDEPSSNTVVYWPENTKHKHSAEGTVFTYKYGNYISGYIHHCIIKKFKLYVFLVCLSIDLNVRARDLGQTYDSNRTLTHYESNPSKGETMLFVGDISYTDHYPLHDKCRWDSWGL
ncbi:hypothetical protein GIB67_009030 [Kingdonia uniflora]|uniref:Uncharacterized protein n=1 Tax=Kingdonia uniflora TaxID=39325 RepID=A0A7J7LW08_9MAGN|nr:hypothetical protein GIB67_009030 [Kingdonia uniflora]